MVNPFSFAATHTLILEDWLNLIDKIISSHQNCIVLVVTFGDRTKRLMSKIQEMNLSLERIIIFENNEDIINLAEIISRISILISPSTGAIHLASNLSIPTIGLYSPRDIVKWATYDKRYVVIPKPRSQLSKKEISTILHQTLSLLESCMQHHKISIKTFDEITKTL